MLLEYLQEYTDRVKPLLDQNELFGKIQTEFEKKWENGTFPGWPVSSRWARVDGSVCGMGFMWITSVKSSLGLSLIAKCHKDAI